MNEKSKSILKLEKMVFDTISFKRVGLKSDSEFKFKMDSDLSKREDGDFYKVTLTISGEKEKEFKLKISLTGFFSFDNSCEISEEDKVELVSKNTIAILMPYLRSEVSILTAQPDTECIVLPPFNINNMFDKKV